MVVGLERRGVVGVRGAQAYVRVLVLGVLVEPNEDRVGIGDVVGFEVPDSTVGVPGIETKAAETAS
jgi:hypothetical protein